MFEPRSFNDVAKRIRGLDCEVEARARSMAGRSYYSLYLTVRTKVLAAAQRPLDDKVGHGELSNALFSGGSADLISLGKLLQELYDCRQQADYRLVPTNAAGHKVQKIDAMRRMAERAADALNRIESLDFTAVAAKLR